jgi:hypothetical protein
MIAQKPFLQYMKLDLIEAILDFYIRNNWCNKEFVSLLDEKLRRIEKYE